MSPAEATLAIGEVARRAGLRVSAIRYYESIGLLPKPGRISGQRRYDNGIFKRLAIIDVAQRAGLTLEEARSLLDGFSPTTPPGARWQELARRKLPEIDELIRRATEMRRVLELGTECRWVSSSTSAISASSRPWSQQSRGPIRRQTKAAPSITSGESCAIGYTGKRTRGAELGQVPLY